jgi:ABC-type glycerol-3-phosphate transport system substrate-binding protein
LKFRTVKLPQLPKNNPTDPNYSYATYWFQGVSDKSKVKEGSWTFLKFLSREDSLRKLNENIKRAESIGRIYPRPAMNLDLVQDQIFGSVVSLAYDAKSWYLAGSTYDGEDGINSQIGTLFEKVVNDWPGGGQNGLEKLAKELSQILGKYEIKTR